MALTQPVNVVPPVVLAPRARPLSVQLLGLAGQAVQMGFLVLIVIVFATPFVWMILGSLRPPAEIFAYIYPLSINTFVPVKWTFQAYLDVLGLSPEGQSAGLDFARYTFNTVFVSASVVACSLVFNTGAAYFFSRLDFPHKEVIFVFVVATMLIPWEATIVPLYLVVRMLHIENSYAALIVPWYASPFIIFAMRQFFSEIPRDLDEAAIMDGASLLQVLRHVIIPNAIPGLITMALLEFQFIWNQFFWPLVAATSKDLMVLQVAIQSQTNQTLTYWDRTFAGSVIATVPVVLLFLRLQSYYVKGVVMSGLKG
ncbi:MAG: carbohydrate ABC transporter permease [Chloroflexi bacterium]|nr:carbohydrate ABC transporter permease [Chloroflexota bacterium]